MRHYIIDGNNLIGKIKSLYNLQKKDGQASRENLVLMLEGYFHSKKAKVTLCFDGHVQEAIRTSKMKIVYSDKKSADDVIKKIIELADNPRILTIITSDSNLAQFARVCHCTVQSSEEFAAMLKKNKTSEPENEKKKNISDDEIKRMFGV